MRGSFIPFEGPTSSGFRLFEVEEVHVAPRVAGKNQVKRVRKCAA